MTKREFQKLVQAEMERCENEASALRRQAEAFNKQADHWQAQAEAARTMSIRLDREASDEEFRR